MASRVTQEVVEAVLGGEGARVRVTQEVLEAVVSTQQVRVTQEVVEAVVAPVPANVRVTQEVLEVALAVPPDEWIVRAYPRVYWGFRSVPEDEDGIVVEDPTHPRGEWRVRVGPHIEWDGTAVDPSNGWIVQPKPRVTWKTGPGTASTECISSDGEAPEPLPPAIAGLSNVAY